MLASRLFFRFPMTTRDVICLGTLSDDDFWFKTTFVQVLDCTNSPLRVQSSRGEHESRMGVVARPKLAAASSYSPLRVSLLARRVNGGCCPVRSSRLFVMLRFDFLSRKLL
jgi:hypothetical protein